MLKGIRHEIPTTDHTLSVGDIVTLSQEGVDYPFYLFKWRITRITERRIEVEAL